MIKMIRKERLLGAGPTLILLLLAACSSDCDAPNDVNTTQRADWPPAGSNHMLREAVTVADGLEVIISDVVIPPGAPVPRHYHPGEEFLYVLGGSAVHVEEGKPDRILEAGDAYVIPPRAVHAPRGGPDGARAVVFRLHVTGQPERILVPEASDSGAGTSTEPQE